MKTELMKEETSTAIVTRGGELKGFTGDKGGKLTKQAEERLIKLSLRVVQIDTQLQDENEEKKSIEKRLKLTSIGKRREELKLNKKLLSEERREAVNGFKELLKFFKDNGVKIDVSKLKAIGEGK